MDRFHIGLAFGFAAGLVAVAFVLLFWQKSRKTAKRLLADETARANRAESMSRALRWVLESVMLDNLSAWKQTGWDSTGPTCFTLEIVPGSPNGWLRILRSEGNERELLLLTGSGEISGELLQDSLQSVWNRLIARTG